MNLRAIVVGLGLAPALLLGRPAIPSADAYTFSQVGVDSNFLFDGDVVYFAQADGTLTALDVATGNVRRRSDEGDYWGTLQRTPGGILVVSHNRIALLDRHTLKHRWSAAQAYDAVVAGDRIVSYDGNGLVTCRLAETGRSLWTYDLPSVLEFVVHRDKVVVLQVSDGATPQRPNVVALLDGRTGRELLRKTCPGDLHCLDEYFDGESIAGTQLAHGQAWDLNVDVPHRLGRGVNEGDGLQRFDVPGGEVTVTVGLNEKEVRWETRVEHVAPDATWQGRIPYLSRPGTFGSHENGAIEVVGATEEFLLLGSNLGHVEAIRRSDGKSLWIYMFPALRKTMSYSAYGLPPMMDQAAAAYHKQNAERRPVSGFVVEGSIEPSQPIIIYDPQPADPFADLPFYLAIAWAVNIGALLFTTAVIARGWWCGFEHRSISLLVLTATVAVMWLFFEYGRVSMPTAVAFRLVIAAQLAVCVWFAIRAFNSGRNVSGVSIIAACGLLTLFVFPVYFRL
jgi:hypothetical protein